MFEKQHEPFEMRGLEFAVDAVKRMRNRVGNIRSGEITLQCENIFPEDDDVVVLLSGNAPDQDVNLAGVLWKIGRDLFADKGIWQIANLKTAVDRVVIGDGDEVHSALEQLPMQLAGVGIRIGKIKTPK